jgi:hypothetical protein
MYMAVGEYLKVAAAQLRRAAQARKAEADDLRKEINHKDQEKRDNLRNLQGEERVRQVAVASQDDSGMRNLHMRELMELKGQESITEREYEKLKQDMAQQVSIAEGDANDLLQRASDLERRATQM